MWTYLTTIPDLFTVHTTEFRQTIPFPPPLALAIHVRTQPDHSRIKPHKTHKFVHFLPSLPLPSGSPPPPPFIHLRTDTYAQCTEDEAG